MHPKLKLVLYILGGALAVLVINKKTGIFDKIFGAIPGVKTLLA